MTVAASPPMVHLEAVTKAYAHGHVRTTVLGGVTMEAARGFVSIVGPNGAGKSTCLRIIAGLESPDSGSVKINIPPNSPIPLVFQDYRTSLLPWLSVEENLLYPLRLRGTDPSEARARLENLLTRFRFRVDLHARSFTLSGGEAQTCCLLRALLVEPKLLLLDEPLSALDYEARVDVRQRIVEATELAASAPVVLGVSHDLEDAVYLADEILFLSKRPAVIEQRMKVPLARPRLPGIESTREFIDLKKEAIAAFQRCLRSETVQ